MKNHSHSIQRRDLLKTTLAAMTLTLAPALAFAQDPSPFKIGVIASLTGGMADVNNGEINGLKLKLKQLDYKIAGRKIELIIEDDAGDPGKGVNKAQKLVESDKVDMVIGPFLGHVVAATQDYFGKTGTPNMPLVGQVPENIKHPNTISPGWNAVQLGRLMGDYSARKLGHKNATIISSKYAFGTRVSEGFKEGFTAAGGQVGKETYVPMGTADWAPFISGLGGEGTVFSAVPGADAIKYIKARHEFGQRDRMPLVGVISTVDGMLLPAMGDAATGSVAIAHYLEELDIPENKQFIADYKAEYKKVPTGYYEALGYTIGQIIEASLNSTKGSSESKTLVSAIKSVDLKTPQGRLRYSADTNFPYMDYYFVKVVMKNGKPAYDILEIMRDVKPE